MSSKFEVWEETLRESGFSSDRSQARGGLLPFAVILARTNLAPARVQSKRSLLQSHLA